MVLSSFSRKLPQTRDKGREERNTKRICGANIAEYKKELLQCTNNVVISNY